MAEYSAGTCTLTNGSATVVGSANAAWGRIPVGAFFIRSGQPVSYQISSVTPVPTQANPAVVDHYVLTLTAPYGGATEAAGLYTIHTSFTANGLPIWSVGDSETVALINRLTLIMEALLSGVGLGGGNVSLVQQVATLVANADTIPNNDTNPPTRQKIAASGAGDGTHIILPQQ